MSIDINDFDIDAFVEDTFKDDRVATTYSKTDAKYRAQVSMLKREIRDIGKQKVELEKKVDKMQRMIDDLRERRESVREKDAIIRKLERVNHNLDMKNTWLEREKADSEQETADCHEHIDRLTDKLSVAESLLEVTQRYINYAKDHLPAGTKSLLDFYAEVRHEYK